MIQRIAANQVSFGNQGNYDKTQSKDATVSDTTMAIAGGGAAVGGTALGVRAFTGHAAKAAGTVIANETAGQVTKELVKKGIFSRLKSGLATVGTKVSGFFSGIKTKLGGLFTNGDAKGLKAFGKNIKEGFSKLITHEGEKGFKPFMKKIGSKASNLGSAIKTKLGGLTSGIKDKVKGLVDKVKSMKTKELVLAGVAIAAIVTGALLIYKALTNKKTDNQ